MSPMRGRTSEVNSVRIRTISRRSSASSSRIRLFASTTTSGSMKTVFPEADSSWTMPLIFRLKAGATGIIRRPSRIVGATSLSTTPSACAVRRIDWRLREMLLIVAVISRRIWRRRSDALSFILPNLSSKVSMRRTNKGKTMVSPASSARAGYFNSSEP